MDTPATDATLTADKPSHFISEIIEDDLATGKHREIVTRFPPEPNGYLHIGHAKSIWLNFGLAEQYQGRCHLRFDDTNPAKEEQEYVDAIMRDVKWLGYDWNTHLYYASDYFEQLYGFAVELIEKGLAYVCSLPFEKMREYRGTLTEPGKNSPDRDRPVAENLDLFKRMRDGEFPDGALTLRAKIDMASPNLNMRDPVLYRLKRSHHQRTGDAWVLYPMYDYTHPISDALEGITHSICTLEFEDHRPLYDWVLDNITIPCHPRQIEFARLNISYFMTSKRKLNELVQTGVVKGWDDPRMPTLAGLRRRGYTPRAIRNMCAATGTTKSPGQIEIALLEHFVREDLNLVAPRMMVVLKPLKVTIETLPEDHLEMVEADNNPEDASAGKRKVPFTRTLYIEQDDFMEVPAKKWFRLSPGAEVRLKHAYYITCKEVIKDAAGNVVELRCTHDPLSGGGDTPDKRVVKGTLHWVSAAHAIDTEVRLYDALYTDPSPTPESQPNTASLEILTGCKAEPGLAAAQHGDRFQFLRMGYFCLDPESTPGHLVFNRTIGLKDTWAKVAKKG